MKKVLLSLVAAALVSAGVYAEDAAVSVSVTKGEAILTWGYDLELEQHGFKNENDLEGNLTIAGTTKKSEGEGWYGAISVTIEGKKYKWDGADEASGAEEIGDFNKINLDYAKITDGTTYITIKGESKGADFAKDFDDDDYGVNLGGGEELSIAANSTLPDAHGLVVGTKVSDVVTDVFVSLYSANTAQLNVDNDYGITAGATAKVSDAFEVSAKVFFDGFVNGNRFGFGVKPVIKVSIVTFSIGVDGAYDEVADFVYETFADLGLKFTDDVTAYAKAYYNSNEALDAQVGAAAKFAPISVGVDARIYDSADWYRIAGNVGYEAAGIVAKLEMVYTSTEILEPKVYVQLKSEATSIENTVFEFGFRDLDFTMGDVNEITDNGEIYGLVKITL